MCRWLSDGVFVRKKEAELLPRGYVLRFRGQLQCGLLAKMLYPAAGLKSV